MRRDERRFEPLHEGGTCNDLDVMVVRGISLPKARLVRVALRALENDTAGLIAPYSVGEIPLPISGGTLLKGLVTAEKEKRNKEKKPAHKKTIPFKRLDAICELMTDMHDFADLTLRAAHPDEPFSVNDHDQVVVELDDTNPQLDADRDKIFESMEHLLRRSGHNAFETITDFRPPEIIIGTVLPYMLDGDYTVYDKFKRNPNSVIKARIEEARELRGELPLDGSIFPESVTFGGLRVVARKRTPEHMFTLRQEIPLDVESIDLGNNYLAKAS